MIHTTHTPSPIGDLLLAERDGKLIGLWIDGQKYYFGGLQDTVTEQETSILTQAKTWLNRYFSGEKPSISELRLAPVGSAFRQQVWQMLCQIPYGTVLTYGDIARQMAVRMGKPQVSAQAVGGAVGHNPLSIIVPCHRVVGSNGSLTGYAAGIDTKRKLLAHEGVDVSRFTVPTKGTAL